MLFPLLCIKFPLNTRWLRILTATEAFGKKFCAAIILRASSNINFYLCSFKATKPMPRYFIELAYDGTDYCGWQFQPGQPTVQDAIEKALATVYRRPVPIVGCGRTDAGVHASQYIAHFEADELPRNLLLALNGLLPRDIAIFRIELVADKVHARFGAFRRSYVYHLHYRPNPFRDKFSTYNFHGEQFKLEDLNAAAAVLLEYNEFAPLCKSHAGVDHFRCNIMHSEWIAFPDEHRLEYHVSSNRFLRGMVRLIVGMCCSVAKGKYTITDIHNALQNQTELPQPWSAPAQGLFLCAVEYRKEDFK
jgi:tRNA pseudouridine38-40 synthase